MTTGTSVFRTTEVVSISLDPVVFKRLEQTRKKLGQSRSAFISSVIKQYTEDERWERIYAKGAKTARKFNITSEDDIDRILHEK